MDRVAWAFLAAYLMALGLLAIGTFGLFGQERDPLSGVFLIPLGLRWSLMLEPFSERLRPWFAAAAPAVNLWIWLVLCRITDKVRSQS